jgi:4-hydroxybenzoate polyprenyltransferase
MNKLRTLVEVSRPVVWPVYPLIFARGFMASGAELGIVALFQAALLTFPISIIIYGINDIYDYDSDRLNWRKGGVEGVRLAVKNRQLVKTASICAAIVLMISSLMTFNYLNVISMAALILLAYLYSAPPVRLKERPPFDSISNGLGYYFLPFVIGLSFGNAGISARIFFITFFVMGIHAFSTVMDYTVDRKTGQKTFSVVFGKRVALSFSVLASITTLLFAGVGKITFAYVAACLVMYIIIFARPSEKLASLFFKLILAGFLLTTTNFFL